VKVVPPFGEIPWRNASRITDTETKRLLKEIVDRIYTFLCQQQDPAFLEINKLDIIIPPVVEAARESLVIGTA